MKRIKVLGSVLKRTRADKIIIGFIMFIFAAAAVIQLVEPAMFMDQLERLPELSSEELENISRKVRQFR